MCKEEAVIRLALLESRLVEVKDVSCWIGAQS